MDTCRLVLLLCVVPLAWGSLENAVVSNARFSRDLYAAVSGGSKNLVCSPLSAQMTLGLIRLGARGHTEAQISRALHLDTLNNSVANAAMRDLVLRITEENALNGTVIRLANRLYAASTLRMLPAFQSDAENYFGAKAKQVDFAEPAVAASTINSWVETFTQGKIKDLISSSSLDRSTQLVLVNALYFRSLWKSAFDPADTRNRPFHVTPEQQVQIPFMFHEEAEYRVGYFRNLDASLIELPYQGEYLSLVIVKPNKVTGLPTLERAMQSQDIGNLLSHTRNTLLEVFLPRFTMEVALELNEPFKQMGIIDMFNAQADLSGLAHRSSSEAPLTVSKVVQKTFIEVTEQGTTAASATYAFSMFLSAGSFNPSFDANSPFLFYLVLRPGSRYRVGTTRTVLFSGRFMGSV